MADGDGIWCVCWPINLMTAPSWLLLIHFGLLDILPVWTQTESKGKCKWEATHLLIQTKWTELQVHGSRQKCMRLCLLPLKSTVSSLVLLTLNSRFLQDWWFPPGMNSRRCYRCRCWRWCCRPHSSQYSYVHFGVAIMSLQRKQEGGEHTALGGSSVEHYSWEGLTTNPDCLRSVCEEVWYPVAAVSRCSVFSFRQEIVLNAELKPVFSLRCCYHQAVWIWVEIDPP